MSSRYTPDPPTWFNLKDYQVKLTPAQWLHALTVRRDWDAQLKVIRSRDPRAVFTLDGKVDDCSLSSPESREQFWHAFREAAGPPFTDDTGPRREPLWEISTSWEDPEPEPDFHPESIHGIVPVAINLNAPDDLIIHKVRELLASKRKFCPPPYLKRGRPPKYKPKATLDDLLHKCANFRILAVFDLQLWHELHGKPLSHANLGRWVFRDRSGDPKELGRQARIELEKALAHGPDALRIMA